jgi:glutathione S-transferase
MAEVKIYSAILCPFAHRWRLTLLEKGIPFESIPQDGGYANEIDLQNKPANFQEISRYSKVPVLVHGEKRVWESAIVNEYLEEVFPNPPLLPTDPIDRARARIWINFADTCLFAASGKLLYGRDSQPTALLQELTAHLLFIEREGLAKISDREPYWLGSQLSLVDLTFYPWFEQINVLEHFRGFQIPPGLDRLNQWQAAVANRESVKSIANSPEFYLEHYGRLAQKMFGSNA